MYPMVIDPFTLILAVIAAGVTVWYFRNRRRVEPPEDEWVLPPDDGQPSILGRGGAAPFEVLDRDALLHRDRTLDPSKWDNTPDGLVGTDPDVPGSVMDEASADEPREVVDSSFIDSLRRAAEKPDAATEPEAE